MSLKARQRVHVPREPADPPRRFCVDDLWTPSAARLPDGSVLQAIAQRVGRAWGLARLHRRAVIGYNDRLRTTLGRAVLDAGRVELNPRLLMSHPAELVPTLAHELAHLAVFWRYGRYGRVSPHGTEFRAFMRSLNLSAAATHQLETGPLRRWRRRYLYLHRCADCGTGFIARRVYRGYYCTACGPDSTWDVFRGPDTPGGRRRLQALLAATSRPGDRACGPTTV